MKKTILIIKEAVALYCIIFTVGTLANSIGVLYLGMKSNPDVHGHIMLRAGLVLLITIIINLVSIIMKKVSIKGKKNENGMLQYTLSCVIILFLLFIFLWAFTSGYLWINKNKFHPNAFRDLFRSMGIPAIVLAVIGFFTKLRKKSHKISEE